MSGIFDQVINYAPPSLLKGTVTYKGTWSAATNTPTLINPPDSTTNGFYYVVSAGGTQFSLVFNIGDWIISNGSAWQKVDNTDAVDSVFGRTGAVVGVSTDYSAVGITATAVGASSPSTGAFTTLSSTSTTTLNSTTIPASKTLVVTTDKISVLAATTSAELAGVISDETGSGSLVFATLPTFGATGIKLSGSTSGTTTVLSGATAGTSVLTLPVATDTLVGKATTDTLTNKTLTSPTITGGALNGTLGATTPSSVAATTGTFSSTLGVTGVATLGNGAILGTPASGTVTNLTGTASININGTVGATTAAAATVTSLTATNSDRVIFNGTTASGNNGKLKLQVSDTDYGAGISMYYKSVSPNASARAWQIAPNFIANGNLDFVVSSSNSTEPTSTTAATLTSTGLNSTAIGATTPSTGAFSTLSATGAISSSGSQTNNIGAGGTGTGLSQITLNGGTGTNGGSNIAFNKNSLGKAIVGIDSCITGGTTDNLMNYVASGGTIRNYIGSTGDIAIFSATGAAITGTLSATSTISTSGTETNVDVVRMGSTGRYGIGFNTNAGGYFNIWAHQSATRIGIGFDTGSYGTFSEKLTVLAGGNVGIGTASPAYRLDIPATGAIAANLGGIFVGANGTDIVSNTGILSLQASGANYMGFNTNSSERMRIDSSGNVGIGVASQISSGKACIQFNGSTHNGLVFKETATASGASFVYFTRSDGNLIGSIARVTTTDAVVYNTTSDARLKENFRDFTDSGRLIDALKPRLFDWKDSDSNGKDVIGFVAQEEHAADPIFAHIGAVSVGDDNPTTITKQWQRSDAALIPILVAELQSLRKRLAALESK